MFNNQPKGLFALALANTGERFGYYTMLAVFALFLRENFGLEPGTAGAIYSTFLGLVYLMPLVGGIMADKFGFGKMVTIGIIVMFFGYLFLSLPLGGDTFAMAVMLAALILISLGTGLFKGNLQVMVGNLYDDPKYADKRDAAFSIFYMAINIGALFAPTAAVKIKEWAMTSLGYSSNDAYHFSFAVACAALVLSIAIYYAFRPTFRHVEGGVRKVGETNSTEDITPQETKSRVIALCLVFAVVIFFWMAFHQNGLALTYFADEFTSPISEGIQSLSFNVWNLVAIIIAVYATFSIFQSKKTKGKLISGIIGSAALAFIVYNANHISGSENISAPIFQQFNPFYVVALTPVSMAIFGALAKKGKEPSAPRKIAYGMLVAAAGFAILAFGSKGLNTPDVQAEYLTKVKAQSFAAESMVNANDSTAMAKINEKKVEYTKKLDGNAEDIFYRVYSASEANLLALDSVKFDNEDIKITNSAKLYAAKLYLSSDSINTKFIENEKLTYFDGLKSEKEKEIFNNAYDTTYKALANNAKIEADVTIEDPTFCSANWLIFTYLILTFAELLLSPMGISFVSKVAPPKLKGMMMGGWFVATAIGNWLVMVGGFLWGGIPLWIVWSVFIVLCLLSALFMFVMMKRLENATK